ncbi:MAG: UDP-3-O-acyl-N-acetylglucosamine deacetylase, partial [Planctomycetota bacterium]
MTGAQRTLAGESAVSGVGLFTASPTRALFRPAPEDHGVVFVRTDIDSRPRIPATVDRLLPAEHRTAIGVDGVRLETVEHCLAALAGLGIDNAIIEVEGPELPIGDGSCRLFVDAIASAGTREQRAPARTFVVRETAEVRCERTGAWLRAEACEGDPVYRYELDYGEGSPIEPHHAETVCTPERFANELADARTFSTLHEAEAARAAGLFTHLSASDMLVIGPDG